MEIRVYETGGGLLGLPDQVTSCVCVLRYAAAGEITLVCPGTAHNLQLLQPGRILAMRQARRLDGSLMQEYGTVCDGFLLDRLEAEADNSGAWLTVHGTGLSGILRQRVIREEWSVDGDGVLAIDQAVLRHCVSPEDPARVIPGLTVAGGLTGGNVTRTGGGETVYDGIRAVAEAADTGFTVDYLPDTGGMRFRQYKGLDRTQTDGSTFLLLDESHGNLLETSYTLDREEVRTTAYVTGVFGGEAVTEVVQGELTGLARWELLTDGSDVRVNTGSGSLTETDYRAGLAARGQDKLRSHGAEEQLQAVISPASELVFRRDYDLGDRLLVRSTRFGVESALQVTAVTERWEDGVESVVPTLGNEVSRSVRRLAQIIND